MWHRRATLARGNIRARGDNRSAADLGRLMPRTTTGRYGYMSQ
jgi:hypothetical protein